MAHVPSLIELATQALAEGRKGLSPKEFGAVTGLSLATVHRRLAKNQLPKFQPGGKGTRVAILVEALAVAPPEAVALPVEPTVDATAQSAERTTPIKRHLSGRRPRWMD